MFFLLCLTTSYYFTFHAFPMRRAEKEVTESIKFWSARDSKNVRMCGVKCNGLYLNAIQCYIIPITFVQIRVRLQTRLSVGMYEAEEK